MTKKKRSASSSRWIQEHESDAFVQASRADGYRSRAVYKLKEIDERDRLIRSSQNVVDLGAAPGGWCQYIARKQANRQQGQNNKQGSIVALDILPMDELAGVRFIQGDFREQEALNELEAVLAGQKVDLVLSDMAPNMKGIRVADQAAAIGLAELALDFARDHLRPGGDFLVKLFQGEGSDELRKAMLESFAKVVVRKPEASRDRSRELYFLAREYVPDIGTKNGPKHGK